MTGKGKKRLLFVIVGVSVSILTFCALQLVESKTSGYRFVRVDNLESMRGVKLLDPNWGGFEIQGPDSNSDKTSVIWKGTSINFKSDKCRVKHLGTSNLTVMATLKNGKEYAVVIDSGNPSAMGISDTIVLEAGTEIYPLEGLGKRTGGLCHLCQVKIGEMTMVHPPCTYTLTHYEKRWMGLTTWKQKQINMGLKLMKSFAYILVDNISGEVEFSGKPVFNPDPNGTWTSYPMKIEPDVNGDERLMVDIPIAGQSRHVQFDTGSSRLVVARSVWEQISRAFRIVKRTSRKLKMPHGFEPCDRMTIQRLRVGDISVSNPVVEVLGDDNPWGEKFFLLGMDIFKNTVVVLDFEKELLWVEARAAAE
jgi:hypothetical protein